MNQMFFIELKNKCDEIQNNANNPEKINDVIKAYDTIIRLNDVARKEGLLALEDEAGKLNMGSVSDSFFYFMLIMVVDGTEPVLVEEAGMNRCIAFNLPSYDGLINLMYLKAATMIQKGENPMVVKWLLESMMPPCILEVLEQMENENALPDVSRNALGKKELVASLCNENEKIDGHDHSITGQLAIIVGKLSDNGIQRMLRDIDNNILSMAMKGLPGAARKKFFDNLSPALGHIIADDMFYTGPVRLKDVEESCASIMKIYVKLADRGEIISTDIENAKLILDIYETSQKQNKEIKDRYSGIKELVDEIYNN